MKFVWVTRDKDCSTYFLFARKPTYSKIAEAWYDFNGWYGRVEICAEFFEKATGIKMKGGPDSIMKIKRFKPIKE